MAGVADGRRVGTTVSVRLGVGVGVAVGVARGVLVGCTVFRGVVGATTGVPLLPSVRNGEVRGGRGLGLMVGFAVGLGAGLTEGLTEAGGLIASGGSDPGESGCSAMTPPVKATAAAATATAAL